MPKRDSVIVWSSEQGDLRKQGQTPSAIQSLPLHQHPFVFYQKLGFVLAGVLPDANGRGKPDIFLVKRL